MPVTLRVLLEQLRVEFQGRARLDGVEPVLLVDRLAAHDRPPPPALFKEVVEATHAPDVHCHAIDCAALHDHHLGLAYRAISGELAGEATQEMHDLNAAFESVPARLD